MMHSFFTSGLFWFIEGVLATLTVIALKLWMEDRGTPMPWWKWALAVCWLLGLGLTIAFIGTSLGENERRAAGMGGLIFGTIVIVAGVVVWRLLLISAAGSEGLSAADSEKHCSRSDDKS